MKYYCFLKPLMPHNYGRDVLADYLRKHLENYIDYQEFEKWFDIKKCMIPLSKVDEIFDISDNQELTTIGLVCNPYTRVWLNYIMNIDILEATTEGLSDFIHNGIYEHPDFLTKTVDVFNYNEMTVNVLLRFENITEDLKQISELTNRLDTNIFDSFYSNAKLSEKYYTEELKKEVYKLFKEDFEYYDYD